MEATYHVGIYCRLSKDDENNPAMSRAKNFIPADESVSIENQREMLSKFVMLNGWIETRTYIDDGYSGGNFRRPGFQTMLEDARNGVINLVLVKDLSRLGRDFVEVGRYTTDVFPSLGVRFVSVLDCLDTNGDTDMLYFRSLMNDYHLRDLSRKIRSVMYSKKASGQYTGGCPPYGYRRSDEDKHKLVIDEFAAGIVRRIFEMRLSGMAYGKITAVLNREGIPAPRFYWFQMNHKDTGKQSPEWKIATVKLMLRNEVYNGTLVMNYCGSRSYKDRTRINKPESEYIRFEENHEPIIPMEMWNQVQYLNTERRLYHSGLHTSVEHMLKGKLVCADCKRPMNATANIRHGKDGVEKRYVFYRCSHFIRTGGVCCSLHSISERVLMRIILDEIQTQAKAITLDESSVIAKLKQRVLSQSDARTADTRKELSRLRRRIGELEDRAARLYEDKISGTVSPDAFSVLMARNEQERLDCEKRAEALSQEISKADKEIAAISEWAKHIRKYMDLRELDREIIDELIDHVEIGEGVIVDGQRRQSVRIFYRFVGSLV